MGVAVTLGFVQGAPLRLGRPVLRLILLGAAAGGAGNVNNDSEQLQQCEHAVETSDGHPRFLQIIRSVGSRCSAMMDAVEPDDRRTGPRIGPWIQTEGCQAMSVRQRFIVGGAAALAVVGGSVGLYAATGPSHEVTAIYLEDTVGVIYEPDLIAGIEDIRFYEPTTVAILTYNVEVGQRTNDLALNDAVLEYARTQRPDWISDNGQAWADDLFIFAVDPDGRFVGTYFGDNRGLGLDQQMAIQDEVRSDLRVRQWTRAAVGATEAAASRMNQPAARSGFGIGTGLLASAGTLAGAGTYIGVGVSRDRRSRRLRQEGDRSFANVVGDYEETHVHAQLIPQESRYGGEMLKKFHQYTEGFADLTDWGNRARSIPEQHYDSKESVETLTGYRDRAVALDLLDDVIADTAALLNLDRAWPEAWEREVGELRTELEGVGSMLESTLPDTARGLPEVQDLRQFADTAARELNELAGGLDQRRVSPDDALDRAAALRSEFSGALDRLARAVAATYPTQSERATMEDRMTVRQRQQGRPTILSTTNPGLVWITLNSFSNNYRVGHQRVESARAAASSSSSSSGGGSSAGYSSSSGGSFGGSGSSSRF